MIASANRLRSVGWLVLLGLCLTLVLVLAFRVNALRSQIHHAEARIVALKQEKMYLETEFETRSNQQQLKSLNDVEFGYQAPTAGQYLEGERQLADLGKPQAPGAPSPIRVARLALQGEADEGFPAMVSPLTGRAMAAEVAADGPRKPVTAATLSEKLGTVERKETARP